MSNHTPTSEIAVTSQPVIPGQRSSRAPVHAEIISEIHEQSVPDFASRALDRLHGSLYASLSYLQLCEPGQPVPHTWVGYRNGEIVGVLLFRVQGRSVRVLSEVIALDPLQIDAFSAVVFQHFSMVRRIVFHAITLQPLPCSWPNQYFAYSENYVLTLPMSNDAYMAALGKSTRQSVRGYRNRLQRDFPDFRWTSYTFDALNAEQQRHLVLTLQHFKRESMKGRGKSAAIDPVETERLLAMAAQCGLFGVGLAEGRVCAGALSCRIGDTYVMLLSASDPAMSKYRLGLLTCLWSVGDCIAQGARQCHLLWGRYAYKQQLLAVPQALHAMVVYPSGRQMLLQPWAVLMMAMRRGYVCWEQWLREHVAANKNPYLQRLIRQCRSVKSMLVVTFKVPRWLHGKNVSAMAVEKSTAAVVDVAGTVQASRCPIRFS